MYLGIASYASVFCHVSLIRALKFKGNSHHCYVVFNL